MGSKKPLLGFPKNAFKQPIGFRDFLDKRASFRLIFPVMQPASEAHAKRPTSVPWLPTPAHAFGFLHFFSRIGDKTFVRRAVAHAGCTLAWMLGCWFARVPIANISSPKPQLRDNDKPLPVVLLSHGLAGNKHSYMLVAGRLAAEGNFVCLMEHRDGSASAYEDVENGKIQIYQFSDGTRSWRCRQTLQRQAECNAAMQILDEINRGHYEPCHMRRGLEGAIDCHNILVAGHSFGGLTALHFAAENPNSVCGVAAADPWFIGLSKGDDQDERTEEKLQAVLSISTPTVVFVSERWDPELPTTKERNNDYIQALVDQNASNSVLVRIDGVKHLWMSDVPAITRAFDDNKTSTDANEAHAATTELICCASEKHRNWNSTAHLEETETNIKKEAQCIISRYSHFVRSIDRC